MEAPSINMASQKHNTAPADKIKRPYWGLLGRRSMLFPTWRGWLLLLDGVMVVEGWVPDFGMQMVIQQVHQSPYHKIYVTGGPVEIGAPLYQYHTLAELGAATLRGMGLEASMVQAVPSPLVYKDRTYTSALALRDWFLAHGGIPKQINLISVGPHSRRSRMLFQRVFGDTAQVGVTALEDPNYDAKHWWHTSQGVRTVTDETIAYCYAKFLFFRSPE